MVKYMDIIIKMLGYEYLLHPKSRLIDLFKLYIQSAFGPGHLINDKTQAKESLLAEVNSQKNYKDDCGNSCLIIPCDAFFPLARYSLDLVRHGTVSIDNYFEAFINTANDKNWLDNDKTIHHWNEIIPYLKTKQIPNFEEDLILITKYLKDGKFILSHTEEYKNAYNPSYRVINGNYLS